MSTGTPSITELFPEWKALATTGEDALFPGPVTNSVNIGVNKVENSTRASHGSTSGADSSPSKDRGNGSDDVNVKLNNKNDIMAMLWPGFAESKRARDRDRLKGILESDNPAVKTWLVRFGGPMRVLFGSQLLLHNCWWIILEYLAGETPKLSRIRLSPLPPLLTKSTTPATRDSDLFPMMSNAMNNTSNNTSNNMANAESGSIDTSSSSDSDDYGDDGWADLENFDFSRFPSLSRQPSTESQPAVTTREEENGQANATVCTKNAKKKREGGADLANSFSISDVYTLLKDIGFAVENIEEEEEEEEEGEENGTDEDEACSDKEKKYESKYDVKKEKMKKIGDSDSIFGSNPTLIITFNDKQCETKDKASGSEQALTAIHVLHGMYLCGVQLNVELQPFRCSRSVKFNSEAMLSEDDMAWKRGFTKNTS